MLEFAAALHARHTEFREGSSRAQEIATDLLSAAISATDYFPPAAPQSSYHAPPPELTPSTALLHIQTCINTGNKALINNVVEKLISVKGVQARDIVVRAKSVLLPLISLLQPVLLARPNGSPRIEAMSKLSRAAVSGALASLDRQKISIKEIDILLDTVAVLGDGTALMREV